MHDERVKRALSAASWTGGLIGLIGAVVAAGWLAGIDGLVSPGAGDAVSFNAAVGYIVAGVTVVAAARSAQRVALAGALLLAVTGAAVLLEEAMGWGSAFDELFVEDDMGGVVARGRPALEVAAGFLLLGVAVTVHRVRPAVAAWVGLALAAVTVVSLLEQVGDTEALFGASDARRVSAASIVALALAAAAIQLLVARDAGAVHALWVEQSLRARLLRTFVLPIPVVAIGPLVATVIVLEERQNDLDSARIVALLGTASILTLVIIGVAVGRWTADRLVEPLDELGDAAARIAAGNLTDPLASRQGDEVDRLRVHFDTMRAALAERAESDALVRRAARAASDAPDLVTAFSAFASTIHKTIAFARATFSQADGDGFVIEAGWSPDGLDLPPGVVLPLAGELRDRVLDGLVATVDDVAEAPNDAGYDALRARGVRSLAAVPIVAAGETRSVFGFTAHEPGAFPPAVTDALAAVCRENAGLFQTLLLLRREREATTRLQEANQLKSDFVGMVAHDLRSPLSVISGFAEIMRERWDDLDDDRKLHFLSVMSRSVANVVDLVEDVLQVARIEAGELSLRIESLDMGALVRDVVDDLTASGETPACEIHAASDVPPALGDEQRHRQVLTNLLSNAFKYSPAGAAVDVTVEHADGTVVVGVADRGPGIAPEDMPKLFQRFSRLRPPPGETIKGTGLGLYICRTLVEAQGGRIWAESTPGHGATFRYSLPIAGPDGPASR